VPQENPVDICSRMSARSNDCTLDDYEIEDGTDPSLRGHDRIPVKWVFWRAIGIVLCIRESQGLAVDAHKVDR
jgi:hypothetical protein